MDYREWDDLGEKIQEIIDSAVSEHNYRKLSQNISQTVSRAIENGSETLKDVLDSAFGGNTGAGSAGSRSTGAGSTDRRSPGAGQEPSGERSGWTQGYHPEHNARAYETHTRHGYQQPPFGKQQRAAGRPVQETGLSLYRSTVGERAKGVLMVTFGGILTCGLGTGFLVMAIAALAGLSAVTGVTGALGVTAAAGALLLGRGCGRLCRVSRFKKYVKALGQHTYCNFEQLSRTVGKSVKYVKKDIKAMISRGWFLEGHVDAQETCLITSNETYRQYEETRKQLEQKAKEAEAKAAREASERAAGQVTKEVQEVLDKGNEYLRKIRESNDAIPGEEISRKISRMELIVQKIFERARTHPEVIPDLKRLMDYYLPMTVKLLDAYEEMDGQPVQGENIRNSKREIEETIDTLNVAFEKLLDSIFQDTAWDVSSDISVLHTVLAQEGLTEDDFEKLKKEAEKKENHYGRRI